MGVGFIVSILLILDGILCNPLSCPDSQVIGSKLIAFWQNKSCLSEYVAKEQLQELWFFLVVISFGQDVCFILFGTLRLRA